MMRDAKGKSVNDLFPQLFESDDEDDEIPEYTDEEIDEMQKLMEMYNKEGGF